MANSSSINDQLSTSSFLTVLLSISQKTMRDLHVASLGIIQSQNSNGTYDVCIVPKRSDEDASTNIICDAFIKDEMKYGDVVLVLFLDRASRNTLTQLDKGYDASSISKVSTIEQDTLHSLSYGIIIAKREK